MPAEKQFEIVIRPPKGYLALDFRELWRFRDLFFVLAWRDIVVRYKQTVLGVLWAIIQPVAWMIVFSVVFNQMVGLESGDNTPYPLFVYAGLLIWNYYSSTLTSVSNSMVNNANIIQKIYFPRLIIPASNSIVPLVDFGISFVVFLALMVWYGFTPNWLGFVVLPVLVIISIAAALGFGLVLAALNVKYRDVRYIVPFVVHILMYVTPVIYPVSLLKNHPVLETIMLWCNPMSGVITFARVSLLGNGQPDWGALAISATVSMLMLVVGLVVFRNTERYFADIA